MTQPQHSTNIIQKLELFMSQYVTLMDSRSTLPLALYAVMTHCYMAFDAIPYVMITGRTKGSGKSRLLEVMGLLCSNPETLPAPTAPQMYRAINDHFPTLLIDEAESLTSEAASDQRVIINIGYRRGAKKKVVFGGELAEFDTYCPKIFAGIGHPYDTLRDRTIEITMKTADPKRRYVFKHATIEAKVLTDEIKELLGRFDTPEGPQRRDTEQIEQINKLQNELPGLGFISDREEEIWIPIFILCKVLCPERETELVATAVDLCASKTAEAIKYFHSKADELQRQDDKYRTMLLRDLLIIMEEQQPMKKDPRRAHAKILVALTTSQCIEKLKAIPSSPWRTYKGTGLEERMMTGLLSKLGVKQSPIRFGSKVERGYHYETIARAKKHLPDK